jgi:hypothetical protein
MRNCSHVDGSEFSVVPNVILIYTFISLVDVAVQRDLMLQLSHQARIRKAAAARLMTHIARVLMKYNSF